MRKIMGMRMGMRKRKRADFYREPVDAHVFMNGWMADRPDGMKRNTKCEAKGSRECQHRTSLQISEGPNTLFGGSFASNPQKEEGLAAFGGRFDADHQTEEGAGCVSGLAAYPQGGGG